MSKYLVTDTVTGQIYPAADVYEVEQVVDYLIDDDYDNYEHNHSDELSALLTDVMLMDEGFDLGTMTYDGIGVSLRRTDV